MADNNKTKNEKSGRKPSRNARNSAARLYAVQGVYQMLANEQSASSVLEEILYKRVYEAIDDQEIVKPDGSLLRSIVKGVGDRLEDLSQIVMQSFQKQLTKQDDGASNRHKQPEGLLFAVLLCGAYELMAHHEIDAPVIISDYLNVGHAYFDRGETKLINGVLDYLAKTLR